MPDPLLGDQSKPALHLVKPGGVGGCVLAMKLRPLYQPGFHFCVLVGAVVVDDQVQMELLG